MPGRIGIGVCSRSSSRDGERAPSRRVALRAPRKRLTNSAGEAGLLGVCLSLLGHTPKGSAMSLPLLKRARDDGAVFVRVSPKHGGADAYGVRSVQALMPGRALRPGEQYRFHVDMQSCIGCKCCVVACNEQNGNPAAINWRRVVEIEGGWYPQTGRSYLSMGCNHCLEPTCLEGCPVDAYSKDALTGIVRHSADVCIGCQYCTWNCSYGVPQYNPERGVVGKCDMCYGRLSLDQSPACVNACPEGA